MYGHLCSPRLFFGTLWLVGTAVMVLSYFSLGLWMGGGGRALLVSLRVLMQWAEQEPAQN